MGPNFLDRQEIYQDDIEKHTGAIMILQDFSGKFIPIDILCVKEVVTQFIY